MIKRYVKKTVSTNGVPLLNCRYLTVKEDGNGYGDILLVASVVIPAGKGSRLRLKQLDRMFIGGVA